METSYQVNLTCRNADEAHLRMLLLTTISPSSSVLQRISGVDRKNTDRMEIRASLSVAGRRKGVEQVVKRLSLEPSVSAGSWSIVPGVVE